MTDLNIPGGQATPDIVADSTIGLMTMRGDSYPENALDLFGPVISWVQDFLSSTDIPFRIELELLYLNTSSIRAMMDIFDILEDAHGAGRQVAVIWYYHDDNQRVGELAEEFREDYTFLFDIVSR